MVGIILAVLVGVGAVLVLDGWGVVIMLVLFVVAGLNAARGSMWMTKLTHDPDRHLRR